MSWNRSSEAPKPEPKKPTAMRGILAGGVIVLAASAALFFLFSGNDAVPKAKPDKKRGLIKVVKEASPAPAPTNAVPAKPVDPREDYDHERAFRDERGILRLKSNPNIRVFDKTRPAHKPVNLGARTRPSPFKFHSEREIAVLLEMVPGERRLISPNYYDKDFIEDFEDSLPHPIVIEETDSPQDKALKKAVAEVKDELAVRVGKGEKLADILTEAKEELERLVVYKDDLKAELDRYVEEGKGELSSADIADYVAAANKLLEERGINPVPVDEFVSWNVQLAAKKLGLDQEAEDRMEENEMKALGLRQTEAESKTTEDKQ